MRKFQASDQWFTDPAIIRAVVEDWAPLISGGNSALQYRVFDPTTNNYALTLHNDHLGREHLYTFKDETTDFLAQEDDLEIKWDNPLFKNIPGINAPLSFSNPPYSKAVGGAGPFVEKHLKVCNSNNLVSVQLINSVISAKWFHKILEDVKKQNRKCAIGLINPRINFYTYFKTIENLSSKETVTLSIQELYSNPEYLDSSLWKVLGTAMEKGTQPRYDNMILLTMPNSYVEPSWKFSSLVDTLTLKKSDYSIKWFIQL